jgi:hypothetical protein
MPVTDTWDWPFLYYAGTVLLKMSPGMFWSISPRRLDLLLKVHIDVSKQQEGGGASSAPTGYIDQLF